MNISFVSFWFIAVSQAGMLTIHYHGHWTPPCGHSTRLHHFNQKMTHHTCRIMYYKGRYEYIWDKWWLLPLLLICKFPPIYLKLDFILSKGKMATLSLFWGVTWLTCAYLCTPWAPCKAVTMACLINYWHTRYIPWIMNIINVFFILDHFTHIHHGYFTGTAAIIWLLTRASKATLRGLDKVMKWIPGHNSRNDPITPDNMMGSVLSHQLTICQSVRIPQKILASIGSWSWWSCLLCGLVLD